MTRTEYSTWRTQVFKYVQQSLRSMASVHEARTQQIYWIVTLCLARSSLASDEESLLAFRQSVRDPSGVLSNWNNSGVNSNSLPVCNWTGVTCSNQTHRVIELHLNSSQLAGSVSPEIGGLTFLQVLDLAGNSFTGLVPLEIGKCFSLSKILLSNNNFSGRVPLTLGNLAFLQVLDLTNNSFTGSVPPEIGNCSRLTRILLSHNRLSGVVPLTLIGNLILLQRLLLAYNCLTSGIPVVLGNCSALTELDLSSNRLNGVIPRSLGNCSALALLNLSANLLTGPIPSSFGNLPKLQRLHLSSNSLTGGFPTELFKLKDKLGDVVLRENLLSGSLPDQFNQFETLSNLDLSNNQFTGAIPYSLGHCKRLLSLSLSHNQFSGVIPSSIGNLSQTFTIGLNLSHNHLSGPMPDGLASLSSTVSIDLSANNLSGEIILYRSARSAAALANAACPWTALQFLDLSKNSFVGAIPNFLGVCVSLQTLDLANNSLGGDIRGDLAGLQWKRLNVSGNNLTGSVDLFTNLTLSSFLPGNSGLCGLILDKPCPSPSPALPPGVARYGTKARRRYWTVVLNSAVAVVILVVIFFFKRAPLTRHRLDVVVWGLPEFELTVEDLVTATAGFNQTTHMIGWGGTSTVYKAVVPFHICYGKEWLCRSTFAVKKFDDCTDGHKRLLKEVAIMRNIRHRNLVGTPGIPLVPRSINVLVMEYMANGTLRQHLYDSRSGTEVCELSWENRLNIAIDVATGVCHLHEDIVKHVAVIHGDLKPANIFLDSDLTAKVGDFGLAKLLPHGKPRIEQTWEGTFGYSPPEHGEGLISTAGDVYSFGVVMLEMVTRKQPTSGMFVRHVYHGCFIQWVRAAFLADKLSEIVDANLDETFFAGKSKDAIELFIRVGLLCTRDNPRERPKMRDVLHMIKAIPRTNSSSVGENLPVFPLRSIKELTEPSFTSCKSSKSWWGWVKKDFIFDILDTRSGAYDGSWLDVFNLDLQDSRILRAMGFDTKAVKTIRKQSNKRRSKESTSALSWTKSIWRPFLGQASPMSESDQS